MNFDDYPKGWFRMSWLKDRVRQRRGNVRLFGCVQKYRNWGRLRGPCQPQMKFHSFGPR